MEKTVVNLDVNYGYGPLLSMKFLVLIIAFLCVSEAFAQNEGWKNDSIRNPVFCYAGKLTTFDFGVSQIKNTVVTVGVSFYRDNENLSFFENSFCLNFNFKGAIGCSHRFDIGLYGINLGYNSHYFYFDRNNYLTIAPSIGINLFKIKIFYSHNFPIIFNNSNSIMNKNSISIIFGIIKTNSIKYDRSVHYKRKYRKEKNL